MRFARPLILTPMLMLMLAACSQSSDVMEELPNSSLAGRERETVPEARMEAAQRRPVTVGEDGPRFPACGGLGQATDARGVAVRAAPFSNAAEMGRMAAGTRAFVCTRSIDQRWLGVVIPPASDPADNASPPVDCGIGDPVDRKQAYAGPCPSGWVSSAAIRLVG